MRQLDAIKDIQNAPAKYVDATGDTLTGGLNFPGTFDPLHLVFTGTYTANARGMVFKNKDGRIEGQMGALFIKQDPTNIYMGLTPSPWDGNNSFLVKRDGCYFNNMKIYNEGYKPSWNDVQSKPSTFTPSSHNHDDLYIKKSATRLNGGDANTIREGGFFAVSTSQPFSNLPINSDGYLLSIPWDSLDWSSQIYINDVQGDMHIRTKTGGGFNDWTPWAKIYDSRNKPTPDEIGAQPKQSTTFTLLKTYVGVRTSNRKPDQYYEFWDANSGWADIKCKQVYAGDGKYRVYHEGNKPSLSELGAYSSNGGYISGKIITPNQQMGIRLGDDVEIGDRDIANHMVLQGVEDNTLGGITFGSGRDTNIYRGGANLLKTDDTFNAVGGLQWNGQSLDSRYIKTSDPVSNASSANTITKRTSEGDIIGRLFRSTYQDDSYMNGAIAFRTNNGSDNYTRYCNNPTAVRNWLGAAATNHNHNWNNIEGAPLYKGNGIPEPPTNDWLASDIVSLPTLMGTKFDRPGNIVFCADGSENANLVIDGFYYADNGKRKVQLEVSQEPLWEGSSYVLPDSKVIYPKKKLSECQNGWILVWADYDPGVKDNDFNWVTSYVPKNAKLVGSGNTLFPVPTHETGDMTVKAVYIKDDRIEGGSTKTGSNWNDVVLRQVLEY